MFHGKAVQIDYAPSVRNPRIIHASIHGVVRRMEDTHATEDELLIRIHEAVTEHGGNVARLVARTPEAIEFSVTRG